jgi:ribosomal protein S18 acetylase RimI-like enzyme
MSFQILPATIADIPQIVTLINNAYRGPVARKGWTHEADLIDGDRRTDAGEIRDLMDNSNANFLVAKENETIAGCVFLELQGNELYLGMLSVDPAKQDKGTGKKLIKASEEFAKQHDCDAIVMTVISVRKELIAWYERLGWSDTGKRKPFPENEPFGSPKQPLEFIILKKKV